MKKNIAIYIAIATITLSFTVNNFGQIGDWIKLANDAIEKKKNKKKEQTEKPKPEPPREESQPPSASSDNQSNNNQTTETILAAPTDKCKESGWLTDHLDIIAERQKEVDEFIPERGWFVSRFTYDHVLYSISLKEREKWLEGANKLDYKDCPNLVAALDKLAASVAKKLPTYKGDLSDYKLHNLAEEKLMKGIFNDITAYQIYSVGLSQSNWLISKNDYGLPTARYKHGAFYLRDKKDDHPYCYLTYVNIIQDYAGGGTYGASYAHYIRDVLVGCPASAK